MFGDVGPMELLIIGAVVILVFGVGKVGKLGKELGTSVKEFRRAIKDDDESPPTIATGMQYTASALAAPVIAVPDAQPAIEQASVPVAAIAGPAIF